MISFCVTENIFWKNYSHNPTKSLASWQFTENIDSKREVIYTTNHTNHQYHHYHHTTHSQKGAKTMKNKFITERKGEYLIDGNILQNRKL